MVDGCILMYPNPKACLEEVTQLATRLPVLATHWAIEGTIEVQRVDGVVSGAWRDAANYLYDLGHRRLAIVEALPELEQGVRRVRSDIFREVARERGMPVDVAVYDQLWKGRDYQTAAEIAQLDPLPTAIVALDDDYARVLISHLALRGVRVPEDVSVFSGHTQRECFQSVPELTGLAMDHVNELRDIVRQFIEIVKAGSKVKNICLSPLAVELVTRASCAAPRVR
jgi:DNA-binding LacI/PurR family transcriptional regulator